MEDVVGKLVLRIPDPFEVAAIRSFDSEDPLLPEQLRASLPILPERRLWIALLDQTSRDLRMPIGSRIHNDAAQWVLDESLWIGSFRWVCEELGLNRDWVREHIVHGGPIKRRNHRWLGAQEVGRAISPGEWTGGSRKGRSGLGQPRHLKSVTDRFIGAVKAGLF